MAILAVQNVPLLVHAGRTFDVTFPVATPTGAPLAVNAPGYTVLGQVRRRAGSPVLHTWTSLGLTPNVELLSGQIVLRTPPAVTATFEVWRRGVYAIVLTDPLGTEILIAEGGIVCEPSRIVVP